MKRVSRQELKRNRFTKRKGLSCTLLASGMRGKRGGGLNFSGHEFHRRGFKREARATQCLLPLRIHQRENVHLVACLDILLKYFAIGYPRIEGNVKYDGRVLFIGDRIAGAG